MTRAEAIWPPQGQFVTIGGRRVHYWRQGAGQPVVLIHGANGNLRDWTFHLAGALAQHHDVIAFDRPSHGYTDGIAKRGDPHGQAALLRAALAALGVSRPLIAGHSYGGAVALAWAVDAPKDVAGLCLIAAPSHEWEGSAGRLYEILDTPIIGAALAATLPPLIGPRIVRTRLPCIFTPQAMPDGYPAHLGAPLALRRETVRATAADISRLKDVIRRMIPRYAELPMPIEMIHGTADTIVPCDIHADHLIRAVPHGTLTRLDGVGHMPHHTHPETVLDAFARLRAA
ncbi:pimeloyl-ACP methyl ester carboxylesterase [Rubricella aquisinus]|uniref:Pimeloyl-ACP methyl ester carboxylesterase n=1 Tax=Rubricella aquisinus TaxID=2028108 RepID=A0A840WXB5_9RHOB|nr:alpha/beta fold hydrolase [Rubricella aquisinus]MBB5515820.1 pimeloyl-ACP methyl ester carboxylesterase [Rubricella aquisinus]